MELHTLAEMVKEEVDLSNVHFIPKNLTELDFGNYDYFYLNNAFYENIEPESQIDYSVRISFELYHRYSSFVYKILDGKLLETRIVTFHGTDNQVPSSYKQVNNSYSRTLKMWIME